MTIAGMVVGTISRMAPSRRSDEASIIAPTSSRSASCSTRWRPAASRCGTSPTEIVDKILHETPAPPSSLNALVPKALDAIVARTLEKSPTFRYQTARDMRQDLRELAAALESRSASAPAAPWPRSPASRPRRSSARWR